jgi:SAM-dependent methyltransferase
VEGSLKKATIDTLLCPVCGQDTLALQGEQTERVQYPQGEVDEIRSGRIACPDCNVAFPIEDYVLSLVNLLPEDIRLDGEYWGQYYNWFYERQSYGYFDLRQPSVPFMAYGVTESIPFEGKERGGMHAVLAHHPLIRNTRRALDVGCGVGWTTLYLARQGFDIIGIDPALQSVKLAKRYALEKQVPVDYIAAGLGYVRFRPSSFDTVFGFHSLHHLPDMRARLEEVYESLKPEGCLAFDEHVQSHPQVDKVRDSLMRWAMEEVFPRYQDARPKAKSMLPPGLSVNEDIGQATILPEVERLFHIKYIDFRFVALDGLADIMYLKNDRSTELIHAVTDVVEALNEVLKRSFPDAVEYVTVIGQKQRSLPAVPQPGLEAVYSEHGALFALSTSDPRRTLRTRPTKWWQLPGKAWRILCYQGLVSLLAEVRSYLRWKRMHGK